MSLIHGMSITDQMTADNVGQNTGYVEEDSGFVLHLRLTSTRRIEKFHKSHYAICYNMTLTDPLNCLRSTGTYLQVGNWVGLLRNLRSSQPAATM